MSQTEMARDFAAMHRPGKPLVLYNVWDVGSARAVARAGARASATSSWALAHSQGVKDGEIIPFESTIRNLERIVRAVDLPVTHDFEIGFAEGLDTLACNFEQVIGAGAVGVNFEDPGLDDGRGLDTLCDRIATLRQTADARGVPVFINIRTSLFFRDQSPEMHAKLMPRAIDRAAAYASAGASGIFVPGLLAHDVIERLCARSALPVNVMQPGEVADVRKLAELGVARISFGPAPFIAAMAGLTERARRVLASIGLPEKA